MSHKRKSIYSGLYQKQTRTNFEGTHFVKANSTRRAGEDTCQSEVEALVSQTRENSPQSGGRKTMQLKMGQDCDGTCPQRGHTSGGQAHEETPGIAGPQHCERPPHAPRGLPQKRGTDAGVGDKVATLERTYVVAVDAVCRFTKS